MDRMNYPRGLVRYTSDRALTEKRQLKILRPRVLIYGGLLLALIVGFAATIGARTPVRLDAIRDRNMLYREVAGGEIENVFSLKLLNLDTQAHRYMISLEGPDGMRLELEGDDLSLDSGEVRRIPVRVLMSRDTIPGAGVDIVFRAQAEDAPRLEADAESRFIGPTPR